MDRCDVLIVGGGPAGSTCAWKLKQAGLDVLVLDKQTFPRDKVCAGWITPAVVETLKIDRADYAKSRVFQPITGFNTGLIDGNEISTQYEATVSYGIRRREFDDYLLQRSGARLLLDTAFQSARREGNEWIVNDSLRTSLLIGAGGHFCPVARQLGAELGGSEPVVAAKEIEFLMDENQMAQCKVSGETPELYFCRDLKGYGWVFRKGDYLNIGLGREDNRGLTGHLDAFCEFLKSRGKIPQEISGRFHGHAYLLNGHSKRRITDDRVMLIGDAAGLAYPQSGEGIRPAIESGLLAAETILMAQGNYGKASLEAYRGKLRDRFKDAKSTGAGVLPVWLQTWIGGRLLSNPWFTRHVVIDQWFLHAHQPALA